MSKAEDRAHKQALRDAGDFWDNHNWSEILQRYAYVANKSRDELEKLEKKRDRGYRLDEDDWEDYEYYDRYHHMLACWIANSELGDKGYEQDKKGRWIL